MDMSLLYPYRHFIEHRNFSLLGPGLFFFDVAGSSEAGPNE